MTRRGEAGPAASGRDHGCGARALARALLTLTPAFVALAPALVALALAAPAPPAAAADAPEPGAAPIEAPPGEPAVAFEIAGATVEPGTSASLGLPASESFAGAPVEIPVNVVHGRWAGPRVCLTAGIHGDEINGIEAVRRASEPFDPQLLRGTIVAVPIVNLHGFRRGSRYLPDRRDLNRFFPGRTRGSAASRVARAVFDGVIRHCDFVLDFHTGSFQRENLPHVRGDLRQPGVRKLADGLSDWLVLDHPGTLGTLRRAATDVGIPALTFEVGGPYRIEPGAVAAGLLGIEAVLAHLGVHGERRPGRPAVARRSHWVRVDDGGLLFTEVEIGDSVAQGERLGVVVDPLDHRRSIVRAPAQGRVIGMAWSQVVMPGFAAFHLAMAGDPPGAMPGAPPGDPSGEPHDAEFAEPAEAAEELGAPEMDERPE